MKVQLDWPIELEDGTSVRAVVVRAVTADDVEIAAPGWLASGEAFPPPQDGRDHATARLVAQLTDLPEHLVDELDGADFIRVLETLQQIMNSRGDLK